MRPGHAGASLRSSLWKGSRVRRWGYIALIVGIALVIALVCYQGAGDVAAAVAAASWGIVVVVLVRLVPIMLDGYVWRLLFLPGHPPAGADRALGALDRGGGSIRWCRHSRWAARWCARG